MVFTLGILLILGGRRTTCRRHLSASYVKRSWRGLCRTLEVRRGRGLGVLWLFYTQLVKLDALEMAIKAVHLVAREYSISAPAAVEALGEVPEEGTPPLARWGTRQGPVSWHIGGSWVEEDVTWRIRATTRSHGGL